MTETISSETRYGYDDLDAGDLVEVTRTSGDGMQVDKIVGTVSERHVFGEQPQIITAFGIFDANRTCDSFRLLKRRDPVRDVVEAWVSEVGDSAKADLRSACPGLVEALDALTKARP